MCALTQGDELKNLFEGDVQFIGEILNIARDQSSCRTIGQRNTNIGGSHGALRNFAKGDTDLACEKERRHLRQNAAR